MGFFDAVKSKLTGDNNNVSSYDNDFYGEVVKVEFTTTDYEGTLTVVDRRYDGFAVHVVVPAEVKARGNALRYTTTSLPFYNYSKSEGSLEIDMLLYNAQQYTIDDKTIRYDEYYNYERDENGNIVDVAVDYIAPADYLASMDIFVMSKAYLRNTVREFISRNLFHMDRDLILGQWQKNAITINVYQFDGKALFNESLNEYFRNSLALIDAHVRHDLFEGNHSVFTRVRDRVPSYYGEGCQIKNSILADGCMLEGAVENSVLFRQVTIGKNAQVRNCVIMNDTVVGEGAQLECVILDKDVVVRPGAKLCGTLSHPLVVKRGEIV